MSSLRPLPHTQSHISQRKNQESKSQSWPAIARQSLFCFYLRRRHLTLELINELLKSIISNRSERRHLKADIVNHWVFLESAIMWHRLYDRLTNTTVEPAV